MWHGNLVLLSTLDEFALQKKICSRGNSMLFKKKLEKHFYKMKPYGKELKGHSDNKTGGHNKQRNYFVSLSRKLNKNHCLNLNEIDSNNNIILLANRKIIISKQIKSSEKLYYLNREKLLIKMVILK